MKCEAGDLTPTEEDIREDLLYFLHPFFQLTQKEGSVGTKVYQCLKCQPTTTHIETSSVVVLETHMSRNHPDLLKEFQDLEREEVLKMENALEDITNGRRRAHSGDPSAQEPPAKRRVEEPGTGTGTTGLCSSCSTDGATNQIGQEMFHQRIADFFVAANIPAEVLVPIY